MSSLLLRFCSMSGICLSEPFRLRLEDHVRDGTVFAPSFIEDSAVETLKARVKHINIVPYAEGSSTKARL